MGNQIARFSWKSAACILLSALAWVGCGHTPAEVPSIQFTKVPPVNAGGPMTMGSIAGKVSGPHEGLKLVLYAKSGRWYVQPYTERPFITVKPDSTWDSPTHLGTDFAALLVQPGYVPPAVIDSLPGVGDGIVVVSVTEGTPPVWRTWWFRLLACCMAGLAVVALVRWRMQEMAHQLNLRFEERLSERTRIAQELHDTLLQGFLSVSMQLHILNDALPEKSPQKQSLTHILGLMGRVIEEGRNAVSGLRPLSDSSSALEDVFSRLPQEFEHANQAELRIVVEGPSRRVRPMVRDEVCRITREAVVNAFRHSGASSIQVELEYGDKELGVVVRDNGRGIDPEIVERGREGHFGLSGMRDRAQNMGGKLKLWSSPGAGTEVGLWVPGRIAFESHAHGRFSRWLLKNETRKDSIKINERSMDG